MNISMHRDARFNATLRLPDNHGIDARNVFVGWPIKYFVRQAHGLIKKLFVIHKRTVGLLRAAGHSYFPAAVVIHGASYATHRLTTPLDFGAAR